MNYRNKSCMIGSFRYVVMSLYGLTHTGKAPWETAYFLSFVLHFGQICSFIRLQFLSIVLS